MTRGQTLRVACPHCNATGERVDEDGRICVCGSCMGHCYLMETLDDTHEPQPDIRNADIRLPILNGQSDDNN